PGPQPPDSQTLKVGTTPRASTTLPASLAFLEGQAFRQSPTLADPTLAESPAGRAGHDSPVRLGGPALAGELARLRADSPPAPRPGRPPDAAARAARGALLRLWRQLSDAVDAYQASIDLDPADPEVHNDLGITFCALGRLADAERCFRRAIGLAP